MSLPRPVWLLGWVSLFTDAATEMIYPLLPHFLSRVLGAGPVSLGLIEGVAEAANSVLKVLSGRLADRTGRHKRITIVGYAISSSLRPLISITNSWLQVLAIRFGDRVGKGIRGAPRDAMLAALAPSDRRGRIYGFHRAMDHTGAVVGPVMASLFLLAYPGEYRTLFALTAIPGAIAVGLLFLVPDVTGAEGHAEAGLSGPLNEISLSSPDGAKRPPAEPLRSSSRHSGPSAAASSLPASFWRLMTVLLVFAMGNSADAFLLLRLGDVGVEVAWMPALWAGLHVIKAGASYYGGGLADRVGRRTTIASGWMLYAAVYAGFAASTSAAATVTLFLTYGVYFGLSEGAERALVADLTPVSLRGVGFGWYNAALGVGALAASVTFGYLWSAFGAPVAFSVGAALAALAAVLLFVLVSERAAVGGQG